MRDAINEFVQFISDDPLMLGLCLAIVALVIIFILVLIFGGKTKDEEEEKVKENTTELLKNDFKDEPLKSTQEFNMESLKVNDNYETQKVATIDTLEEDELQKNAPISVDEALNLKNQMAEQLLKDTIPIPVIDNSNVVPINIPEIKTPNVVEEIPPVVPILEEAPVMPKSEIKPEIVTPSIDMVKPEVHSVSSQPFSSVYVKDEVKPEMSSPIALASEHKEETTLDDDIDLPKLKSDTNSTVMNSLTGEMFSIK